MATWNPAYELEPKGSNDPSEGDNEIRDLKVEIRTRTEKEHTWGGTSAVDGPHLKGSARVYFQAGGGATLSTAPTVLPDGSTNLSTGTVSDGRVFIDNEDNQLYVFDSTANAWESTYVGSAGYAVSSGTVSDRWSVHGSIHQAGGAYYSTMSKAMSNAIPEVSNSMIVNGSIFGSTGDGTIYITSKVTRKNATEITLYYGVVGLAGTYAAFQVDMSVAGAAKLGDVISIAW